MPIESKQIAVLDAESELADLVPVEGQVAFAKDTAAYFQGDGSTFTPMTNAPIGIAGGDLRGSYPDPKLSVVSLLKWSL